MRRCQHPLCELPLPADVHHRTMYCDNSCANSASYLRNREARKSASRAAYRANPERRKETAKAYYDANTATILARHKGRRAMLRRRKEAR